MTERPEILLQSGRSGQALRDRVLDSLLMLALRDMPDGRDQVEGVLATVCRLEHVRVAGPDEADIDEPPGRAAMLLRADNGVRFFAWPPERLTDPDVKGALLLAARFVPRLRRARTSTSRSTGSGEWDHCGGLVGRSEVMVRLHERIAQVAQRSFTVLIEGESGVGKELVARHVHELSARRRGPFVAVNCAAIVESLLEAELFGIEERTATGVRGRRGKFEQADGGTLFLDEVSDLSLSAQAKLLRAIQDLAVERVGSLNTRKLDVRIIAATNRPLSSVTATGDFRRDLYYRLNAVEIAVPPLRARRDDIALLASTFLERYAEGRRHTLAPGALDALTVYEWPGNVRELERVIERAVTLAGSDIIGVADLPDSVTGRYREVVAPPHGEADQSLRAWGARYARMVLARAGGNKREACRVLRISYHTLQSYLSYGTPGIDQEVGGRDMGVVERVVAVHEYPPLTIEGPVAVHDAAGLP